MRWQRGIVLAIISLFVLGGCGGSSSAGQVTLITIVGGAYGGNLTGITTGPDGTLWVTTVGAGVDPYPADSSPTPGILRVTPSGQVTAFALPPNSPPYAITSGPDGNLWFMVSDSSGNNEIGRITPEGQITEYPVPTGGIPVDEITAGPDGNLWFSEAGPLGNTAPGKIGRITPDGHFSEFALPTGITVGAMTSGPENSLWFTSLETNEIWQIKCS